MTADTDREARLEDVLERERYEEALKRFAQNTAGTLDHIREGKYRRWLEAHDAALRAEIDRLHGIARDAYVEGYYDGVEAERERNIQPRSTVKILADAHLKAKLEGEDGPE